MAKHKLVIFDCDGVLVDSELISATVIADVLRPLGIEMTPEEAFKKFVGGSWQNTIAYVTEVLGQAPKVDLEKEYRELSFIAYRQNMVPVEGVENILDSLMIKKCVGSNGPQAKIKLNLEITGLDRFFNSSNVFSAYDYQKWKPEPDLYYNAAEAMRVQPSECIVIEDSVHGMQAAQTAGMLCLGHNHPLKPLPTDLAGTEVYNNMYEIKDRLVSLGVC